MRRALLTLAVLGLAGVSCTALSSAPLAPLASARSVPDFDSYHLRRVGLLPFSGTGLDSARSRELQDSFLFELARRAPYEVVLLTPHNLAEVDPTRPYERGVYTPRSILDISTRFRLDGLLVGTVTQMQVYAPQVLGLQLELVSSETGLVIWSSTLHLDAADAQLRLRLERYQDTQLGDGGLPDDLQVTLLSPARLLRFAAAQVAQTL